MSNIYQAADNLRSLIQRIDALRAKRDEIDKEEQRLRIELDSLLGKGLAMVESPPAGQLVISNRPRKQTSETQADVILGILQDGPKARDEIYAKMQECDKAPAINEHLSPILSRMKSKGILKLSDGKWSLAGQRAAE